MTFSSVVVKTRFPKAFSYLNLPQNLPKELNQDLKYDNPLKICMKKSKLRIKPQALCQELYEVMPDNLFRHLRGSREEPFKVGSCETSCQETAALYQI